MNTAISVIDPIHILISGKICSSQQISILIEQAITKILSLGYTSVFYFLEHKTYKEMQEKFYGTECLLVKEDDPRVEYVLTFGGDGTILYSAKIFKKNSPIFLAFQKGTLGFLCKFTLSQINIVLQQSLAARKLSQDDQNPFNIVKHMRIQCLLKNNASKTETLQLCLNQVAITRDFKSRIILQIYVNNQFLTETGGDGILISTPTGSTAYALSAGGPVVQNGVDCITIVPIAPHSLSFRPICLHTSSVIKIKFSQKSNSHGYISFDGQKNEIFSLDNQVIIKKSQNYLTFFEPKKQDSQLPNWSKRLKIFLNWNQPFKNNKQEADDKNDGMISSINKSKL